jgi:TetR/AcrR family transcriptional regulator, mexJK operon transcriptional repressor
MTSEPTTAPDLSRSDAKRRAILDVATEVFLAQGYAATSMSEIAARAGGSKGTLYNYFRSKDELFSAFITDICQGPAMTYFDPLEPIGEGRSVRDSLIELGLSLLAFLHVDEVVAMHRLVVAEVGRFPELGAMFFEAGPRKGEIRFAEAFEAAMDAGYIPRNDPMMVGQRLKDLVMSDIYLRRLWGAAGDFRLEAMRDHVARSVDIFLRAFGPASDQAPS